MDTPAEVERTAVVRLLRDWAADERRVAGEMTVAPNHPLYIRAAALSSAAEMIERGCHLVATQANPKPRSGDAHGRYGPRSGRSPAHAGVDRLQGY